MFLLIGLTQVDPAVCLPHIHVRIQTHRSNACFLSFVCLWCLRLERNFVGTRCVLWNQNVRTFSSKNLTLQLLVRERNWCRNQYWIGLYVLAALVKMCIEPQKAGRGPPPGVLEGFTSELQQKTLEEDSAVFHPLRFAGFVSSSTGTLIQSVREAQGMSHSCLCWIDLLE